VVVDIVNVKCVTLGKAKNHAPIRANRYRPKAFQPALERMQPESRQVHVCNGSRRIQTGENVTQLLRMLAHHATRVVVLIEPFQSFAVLSELPTESPFWTG